MSGIDDYAAKIDEIDAITGDEINYPTMPIDAFLQEAENIYKWVESDKEKLLAAGLDWTMVEDIPLRAGALRETQAVWITVQNTRAEIQKEWKERSPQAYDLRDTLSVNRAFHLKSE